MVELNLHPVDFEYVKEDTWVRDVITVNTNVHQVYIGDLIFHLDDHTAKRFRAAVPEPVPEPVIRSWQDEPIDEWFPLKSTQHVIKNTDEDWFIMLSPTAPVRKIKALLEAAYAAD